MNGDMDRLLERIRQGREARERELAIDRRARSQPGAARVGEPITGARVFDTVTGQEGDIVGGATENLIVPTARR